MADNTWEIYKRSVLNVILLVLLKMVPLFIAVSVREARVLRESIPAIFVTVSIAVKRQHSMTSNSYKGKYLIQVVADSFKGSIYCHHGGHWLFF